MKKINKLHIYIGLAALIVGTLVYIIDRPPDRIYFLYKLGIDISLYNKLPPAFGFIGSNLPTFSHVYAFILFTTGILSTQKKGCFIVSLSWFGVDALFELGQNFKVFSTRFVPDWFSGLPFFENTRNYFIHGTFDLADLFSIALGSVAAYYTAVKTLGETKS